MCLRWVGAVASLGLLSGGIANVAAPRDDAGPVVMFTSLLLWDLLVVFRVFFRPVDSPELLYRVERD
jgi:hypothetical protein